MKCEIVTRLEDVPNSMALYTQTLREAYTFLPGVSINAYKYNIITILIFNIKHIFKKQRRKRSVIRHVTEQNMCFFFDPSASINIITVHDLHALYEYNQGRKGNKSALLWKYWLRRYDSIVVPSITTFNAVSALIGSAERIKIIENVVNSDEFIRSDSEKKYDLLLVGNSWYKNQPFQLSAISLLNTNRDINVAWLDPDLDLLEEYNSRNANTIIGFKELTRDSVKELYGKSRILCFCSLFEGFGYPILEAYFSGLTVVTSKSVIDNFPLLARLSNIFVLSELSQPNDLFEVLDRQIESDSVGEAIVEDIKYYYSMEKFRLALMSILNLSSISDYG